MSLKRNMFDVSSHNTKKHSWAIQRIWILMPSNDPKHTSDLLNTNGIDVLGITINLKQKSQSLEN